MHRRPAVLCCACLLALPLCALAQSTGEGEGGAATAAPPDRSCWPALSGAETEKPGGAIGRMVRLESGKSPTARFREGESLVVVVALPTFKKDYALEFQATPDVNVRKSSEILWPSVVIVDADFCALQELPELAFESHYSFFTAQTTTRARVPITGPAPRYALVYSDPRKVGEAVGFEVNGIDWGDLRRSEQGYVMVRLDR